MTTDLLSESCLCKSYVIVYESSLPIIRFITLPEYKAPQGAPSTVSKARDLVLNAPLPNLNAWHPVPVSPDVCFWQCTMCLYATPAGLCVL